MTIKMITTILPKKFGGRTTSLLERARLLNSANVDIQIITSDYNPNYSSLYQKFYNDGRVLKNTSFLNLYDYFAEKLAGNATVSWKTYLQNMLPDPFETYIEITDPKNKAIQFYFKDGIPAFRVNKDKSGNIKYFTLYQLGTMKTNVFFFVKNNEFVNRIDYTDADDNVIKRQYLTNDATLYHTKITNADGKALKFELLDGDKLVTFKTQKKLITYFYKQVLDESDVVISDARYVDRPLLDTNVKKRIFQLHSVHLEDPLGPSLEIKRSFKTVLESDLLGADDIIVTLTDEQKRDILQVRPSLANNITVIPHSTPKRTIIYDKLGKHFVMVLRLTEAKNIPDAIKAFSIFHKTHPDYIFDIYGDGELESQLRKLIKDEGLTNSVILQGRTDDIEKAYQTSDALLVTSFYEGFGLNVLESISNGTPVITYPIKYGPADIIDANSGIVAEERTPESLANAMETFINSDFDQQKILQRSEYFSQELFIKRWMEIL